MMREYLQGLAVDWHRKLSAFFWAIILYQYIHWLSNQNFNGVYWLDPSIWSAHASLFAVLGCELVFHARRSVRLLIQALTLAAVHVVGFDYRLIWFQPNSLEEFLYLVELNVSQFMPYTLFGFVTAAVFLLIAAWSQTKARILIVVAFSVVLFAAIDSFSREFYFSTQVAIMVFCGLMLLVIRHFYEFKEKYPGSWEHMKEYPASIFVPIALLAGVIVLSGILAPHARPLLKDPYTLWKNWRGEQVAALGKGFNAPSAIPLGNSSSGYGRLDSELGGGFEFDYSTVLRVSTSHRSYWRGEVRSYYNGKGWEQSASERETWLEPVHPGSKLSMENSRLDLSKLQTEQVSYSISRVGSGTYPVLFGAFSFSELTSVNGNEDQYDYVRWAPWEQTVRWQDEQMAEYPMFYTGISEVPIIDEDGLREADVQLPEDLMQEYTQLPANLPERVRELAEQVTENASNAYDKMKLLEQFLRSEYEYNNRPDTSELENAADFVDHFLFEVREGYCDYFSTAMVVMARSLGVPARWVKGYATGVYDLETIPGLIEELLELSPTGEGTYTIRNADAHSWVEVYFAGYGWIPFEPTANFALPLFFSGESAEEPELFMPELPDVETGAETAETQANRTGMMAVVFASIGLLFAVAAVWFLARTQRLRSVFAAFQRPKPGDTEYRARIIAEFNRFVRFARRKGFARRDCETVRESVQAWIAKSKWLENDLRVLADLFEKAKYSDMPVEETDLESVRNVITKLRTAMK